MDPAAHPDDTATRSGAMRPETRGLLLGLIGVAVFSLTLPMTRLAVVDLDPVWIGLTRALLAALPAAAWLAWVGAPRPSREMLPRLAIVAGGVIVGFPTLTSVAMRHVDASHGAVVLGVLPLATALAGAWLAGERPSRSYWAFAVLGAGLVCAFALRAGGGRPQPADGLLVLAVIAAAIGYAEGARVSQKLGGPQTICWTLVYAAPFLAPVVAWLSWVHGVEARPSAWLGFAYVTLFSQLLGFFAWYKALAIGGIARVSQVQLLQTFMTLGFAAVVAGERPTLATWAFAAAVVAVVAAQRASAIAFLPRGGSTVAAATPPAVSPAPAQARPAIPTDPDQ
ncbi:MAG: DMT family transporter [Burkholderiales bacterium]|jgi:drug/metabolite transporter (DMT)-like permease